jgi:HEPN domain-containing protein
MDKDVKNWCDISAYDMATAEAMYKSGRYLYVLFMCQQAVEKMLKALVQQETGKIPPKIHDLERLSIMANIKLDAKQLELLRVLNGYFIESRYPEEIEMLMKEIDKKITHGYLKETEEILKWLRLKLK